MKEDEFVWAIINAATFKTLKKMEEHHINLKIIDYPLLSNHTLFKKSLQGKILPWKRGEWDWSTIY